jgi:hypothetical protein
MMEYTSKFMVSTGEEKEGTKIAKGVGGLERPGNKKRNEIEDVLEICEIGTGTRIVHWDTL